MSRPVASARREGLTRLRQHHPRAVSMPRTEARRFQRRRRRGASQGDKQDGDAAECSDHGGLVRQPRLKDT